MNHPTGIYEVVNTDGVYIRREPRIVDNSKVTNRVGKLKLGDQRRIYGLTTDKLNVTWGRVSEADAAGVAQWVCIEGLNRVYLKCIDADPDPVDILRSMIANIESATKKIDTEISDLEARIADFDTRLSALENKPSRTRKS